MEETFSNLKKQKQNSVASLIKWMKDSKLIGETKEDEDNACKLFANVKDDQDVDLETFKQVLSELAEQQKKTADEFSKTLSEEGPKFIKTIQGDVMTKATCSGIGAAVRAVSNAVKNVLRK